MAELLSAFALLIELAVQLILLPVRLLFWRHEWARGRRQEEKNSSGQISPKEQLWLARMCAVILAGIGVYIGWYWVCVISPRELTRTKVERLADAWKERIQRDGPPQFERKTLTELDAWGRELELSVTNNVFFTTVLVLSLGADGEESTMDEVAAMRWF